MPLQFGETALTERFSLQGTGLLVADRYGQIFHVVAAPVGHVFPSARELTEWLKYLGTLCPECDVPDEPSTGD
jgi:hypothetical protein